MKKKNILSDSSKKIYDVIRIIPKGKVLTYKKVAEITNIKNPRLVGSILHANKNPNEIPCHRVIKSNGKIADGYAFGGKIMQTKKLKDEGVYFLNEEHVDLNKSLYKI